MIGRIDIQPDDVPDFLDQQRVGRQLEGLAPMRAQPKRLPDPTDGHATQPSRGSQRSRAPVRGAGRRRFQCHHHDPLHVRSGHRPGRPRSWFIQQSVEPIAQKSRPPLADRRRRDSYALGHDRVVVPLRARQHDARSTGQLRSGSRPMGQRGQAYAVVFRQNQSNFRASQSHAHLRVELSDRAAQLVSLFSGTGH